MTPPDVQALIQRTHVTAGQNLKIREKLESLQNSSLGDSVRQRWEELLPMVTDIGNQMLRQWLELALLGTCTGFAERNLSATHPDHQYIYPRIIEDVTAMFEHFQRNALSLDSAAVEFQVFDYGIQWVYYLDWDLYMSKELY
ncbi:MAG: hypothetical protein HQM11_14560 [SAR324 cluster bacterium]|nr:hypothetical protein [SAR324 cluster bacterium]